jgi:hypothetical protein
MGLGKSLNVWRLSPLIVAPRGTVSAMVKRRRRGEDSISFDHRGPCTDPERHRSCPGRWRAEISRGYDAHGKRIKKKVTAPTKTALLDRLKELREDLDSGIGRLV